MNLKVLILPLVAILTLNSCSENNSKGKEGQSYLASISGGTKVVENNYTSTVRLIGPNSACTGTLIDYKTVITAAHCIYKESEPNQVYTGFENFKESTKVLVGTGAIGEKNHLFKISYAAVHPDYLMNYKYQKNRVDISSLHDYAYLELTTPVPEGLVKIIPPLNEAEINQVQFMDSKIEAVGFGIDENGMNGVKKLVKTRINTGTSSKFSFGSGNKGVCPGDSGGPTFITLSNGQKRLVSVSSYISGICGDKNSDYDSWAVRIKAGIDFIKSDRLKREGQYLYEKGNVLGALDSYHQSLELVPENFDLAVEFLSIAYEVNEGKDYTELATDYYLFNMGYMNYLKGNYEASISFMSGVNNYVMGQDGDKDSDLAYLYFLNKDTENSLKHFQAYLQSRDLSSLEIEDLETLLNMALALREFEVAKDVVARMLEIDPNSAKLYYKYALIYHQLGDIVKALDFFNTYFELESGLYKEQIAYFLKKECMILLNASEEEIKKFETQTNDDRRKLAILRLKLLEDRNKWKTLIKEAQQVRELYPEYTKNYYYESLANFKIGKYERALELANEGIIQDANSADLLNLKGEILDRQGKPILEITQLFRMAVKIQPDHASASSNLVTSLVFDSGSRDEAERVFLAKETLGANFKDYSAAKVLYDLKRDNLNLLRVLVKLVEMDPRNHYYYSELAKTNYELGNFTLAEKLAQDVLDSPFLAENNYIRTTMEELIVKVR